MKRIIAFVFFGILLFSCKQEEYEYNFQDPSLSFEERADDLLSLMTLEEKISQLNYRATAIERLGIPEYNWWNECLHGVARAGEATVFPQAIGLAAMWDKDMMSTVANVISDEARAKHHEFVSREKRGIYQGLTFWSPNINIFRDPRWGRGMETYGEDPYLTGQMAVRFIKGLQGDDPKYLKTVATAKHYVVHSGPEPDRHSFNEVTSVRDFRDTYLPAFKYSVQEGGAWSVMCAYNRYMGEPCCGSSKLQNEILRDELGFEGYIVSDCGAIRDFFDGHNVSPTREHAAAEAFTNGTDLNCGNMSQHLLKAVEEGLIDEQEIDIAVKRLMLARLKLGMFDPVERVKYTQIPYSVVCSKDHQEIALEAARKSIVLLKNDNLALPLPKNLSKIAVIGPNATDDEALLGNYNGIPRNPVTPLQGILNKVGENTDISFALGCHHAENIPFLSLVESDYLFTDESKTENGLKATFYNNLEWIGEPVLEKIDPVVDYYWWDREVPENLENDNFSVQWEGILVPPVSGRYALGCEAKMFELFIDGEKIRSHRNIHHSNKLIEFVELEAGKSYKLLLKTQDWQGDALCKLIWEIPGKDLRTEAINLAQNSDHVIMVMGLSPRLEGEEMKVDVDGFEGGDRITIDLPVVQKELIASISSLGVPVTLVLMNGSALSINEENEKIQAIVEAWYAGEAAGTAIADVLFGDYNPAGRIPVTYYKSVNDLPPFEDYDMAGRTYRYFEGDVLYPFGHGLSYSNFEYSGLSANKSELSADEKLEISVEVTNTSERDGEEVVQLYISYPSSDISRPVKDLRGFERTDIKAGETKTITFTLEARDFEYYDVESGQYEVEKGKYKILVGPSSDLEVLSETEIEMI
ncbi:MAG: glycoside hydrolase family 3 C-terminal domain-containing protein [Bacteroidales bacterium]